MDPTIIVAIISGAISLVSLGIAAWTKRGQSKFENQQRQKQLQLESELRLAEDDRKRLRELHDPERFKAAQAFAWMGHALLRWIEQTPVVTRLAHQPTHDRHRADLEQANDRFSQFLESAGYLVGDNDRVRLRSIAKAGEDALLVLTARPPSARPDELGPSEPLIDNLLQIDVGARRRDLDAVCRRLSGVDALDDPGPPKACNHSGGSLWAVGDGVKRRA